MNKTLLKGIGCVLAGMVTGAVPAIVTDVVLEKTGLFPSFTEQMEHGLHVSWMLLLALTYRLISGVGQLRDCEISARSTHVLSAHRCRHRFRRLCHRYRCHVGQGVSLVSNSTGGLDSTHRLAGWKVCNEIVVEHSSRGAWNVNLIASRTMRSGAQAKPAESP